MKYLLCQFLVILALVCPAQDLEQGTLEGAKYLVSVPKQWNGKLLIIAHGFIPEQQELNPGFSPEKEVYLKLSEHGWIIASSSYRRNGLIIFEAIEDLNNLYDHVIAKYGEPELTLIQGSSMGGMIGTLIAEQPERNYHGILNMGAALQLNNTIQKRNLSYKPKIPILFLNNQSEYQTADDYLNRLQAGKVSLWKIARDGHVNINQVEQEMALEALVKMVEGQPFSDRKEGTVKLMPVSKAIFTDGGVLTGILWSDPVYGNLISTLTEQDMKKLHIGPGNSVGLVYRNKSFQMTIGTTYNDVPAGQWVAFLSGEGTLQISCNYCNAQKMLDYQLGDSLFIKKLP